MIIPFIFSSNANYYFIVTFDKAFLVKEFTDASTDIHQMISLTQNPKYCSWLREVHLNNNVIMDKDEYTTLLYVLYTSDVWFVSEEHSNKDKYMRELTHHLETLRNN